MDNFTAGFMKEAMYESVLHFAQKSGAGAAAKNYLGRFTPGRERARAGLSVLKSLRKGITHAKPPMESIS